jgi:hypothetical protein
MKAWGKRNTTIFESGSGKKGIQFHPFPAEGKKVEMIYHFLPKTVSFFSDFSGKKTWAEDNGWMN